MPYVLSPMIQPSMPALWAEGAPYKAETIYDLHNPQHPPVRYGAHTIKPHSLPHVDAPAHIMENGHTIDGYFSSSKDKCLYGPVTLLKLQNPVWKEAGAQHHCEVDANCLQAELRRVGVQATDKLILSLANLPLSPEGQHDPNYALTLSADAAEYLLENPNFNAYLTSWKSTDFQPGSRERPIHRILFRQAAIFECLDVRDVPEGRYFLSAFPLPLVGASESPVCPVLFTFDELRFSLAH
jgi:arylformamidase